MVKYAFKHKLFEGGWSNVVTREVFERGHAIAVLPYDPVLDEFVLIEQVRIGALPTSSSPWLLEVVAGIIDAGETPEHVCYRETKEEAGLEIKKLHKALSYLSSPGGTTERLHIYIGLVDASNAKGVHGLEYESEDILVQEIYDIDVYVRPYINTDNTISDEDTIIILSLSYLSYATITHAAEDGVRSEASEDDLVQDI